MINVLLGSHSVNKQFVYIFNTTFKGEKYVSDCGAKSN